MVSTRSFERAALTILASAVLAASASSVRAHGKDDITPSHVFQQTQRITAEIHVLRAARGVADTPRDPGIQANKDPIHVYAKCLEVVEKVARLEATLGPAPAPIDQIPLRRVRPAEVFECAQRVLRRLERIFEAIGAPHARADVPFVPDMTPSDVYENMWRASYLLDGVVGQVGPDQVFRNAQCILVDLDLVASVLGVELTGEAPQPEPDRIPLDVNLQGFINLYQIASIERALGMTAVRVPDFPPGRIRPSDVYDTTHTILAELVRLKVQLGIRTGRAKIPAPEGVRPADVHAQMVLIRNRLGTVLGALEVGASGPPLDPLAGTRSPRTQPIHVPN